MKQNLTKPCKECPFRRAHMPGWLGPYSDPRELIVLVDYEVFPCHRTIPGKDSVDEMEACVGAAHFSANRLSIPRDPRQAEATSRLGPSDEVFASSREFIEHHETHPEDEKHG